MQVGNDVWDMYVTMLKAGQAQGRNPKPRGANEVGATPAPHEANRLRPEWAAEVKRASHAIYSFGTPIAWYDAALAEWVVPRDKYSPMTTAAQNRIRSALDGAGTFYRTTAL